MRLYRSISSAERKFIKETFSIAVPVALQSMLQSSFSMIDQVMLGRLGKIQIAAAGIGGRPVFIYSFVMGAIATITGIMVSQYIGRDDIRSMHAAISVNLTVSLIVAAMFMLICLANAPFIVSLFSNDGFVCSEAAAYLAIIAFSYVPGAITLILSVPVRTAGHPSLPMYVSFVSAFVNTGLNYLLIFGKCGFPALGIKGAAAASAVSQAVSAVIIILIFIRIFGGISFSLRLGQGGYRQYISMLLPVLINEFMWSLGQSVNTSVYGRMGTTELAGMSITEPIQGLTIGMLSGISQAAGILIGKALGEEDFENAYERSKKLCLYGAIGALILSLGLVMIRVPYTSLYNAGEEARQIGNELLLAFAMLLPVKVLNMILGGGIIRSGGKTKYIMTIDLLGTWGIDVPLVLICGLFLKLPIVWVYFIMSQEELFRLVISVFMFRSRKWMNTID